MKFGVVMMGWFGFSWGQASIMTSRHVVVYIEIYSGTFKPPVTLISGKFLKVKYLLNNIFIILIIYIFIHKLNHLLFENKNSLIVSLWTLDKTKINKLLLNLTNSSIININIISINANMETKNNKRKKYIYTYMNIIKIKIIVLKN